MSSGTQKQIASTLSAKHGVAYSESTPNIGTSAEQALPANTERKLLIIENRGDTATHLSFGGTATTGHLKLAAGERLTLRDPAPTDAVSAIAVTDANDLYIAEA